jgi:glycosyltransferase involved in cell wall biosynthesis
MHRRAIRYYSMGDGSGYSLAAVAYVRGLVNAGVEVEWIRLRWPPPAAGDGPRIFAESFPLRVLSSAARRGALADLPSLIERTSRPVSHEVTIVHATPDYWPGVFAAESDSTHVGMTVWETDRPPAYWLPLLNLADRIIVPCRMNRDDFQRADVRVPVHAVPHIRQHTRDTCSTSELTAMRNYLRVGADDCVFYSINSWDPRKAMPELIEAFIRAFDADDKVMLVLKTEKTGHSEAPFFTAARTGDLANRTIEECCNRLQRRAPPIRLINERLDDHAIGMLHQVGHCFVSLSHSEGWGLGAFEAATIGKPVIMTGWSAPLEYMVADNGNWPGAIPHTLVRTPIFPVDRPSYFSSQRWAQADIEAAAALMRRFFDDGDEMRRFAQANRIEIVNRFAEPVVTHQLLEAIGG